MLLTILFTALLLPQAPDLPTHRDEAPKPVRLPNGKLQSDEILKADLEKNREDAARLQTLCEEVRAELEKAEFNVLSLGALKKLEEIEKISKRLRSRMKRF